MSGLTKYEKKVLQELSELMLNAEVSQEFKDSVQDIMQTDFKAGY